MKNENNPIEIDFPDHVAIGVKDLNISADWYQEVLGLKKYQVPEWVSSPFYYSQVNPALLFSLLKQPIKNRMQHQKM